MKLFDKVIIVKSDMDTIGVGFLFGVTTDDRIEVVAEKASQEDLRNPRILCIEAGGDGGAHLLNFDHHAGKSLPSATYQARQYFRSRGITFSAIAERIVSYIHIQDSRSFGEMGWKKPNFISSLSSVCAGMAINTPDLRKRFLEGIKILCEVERLKIDPFGPMPVEKNPSWQRYVNIRQWGRGVAESLAERARWSETNQGRALAICEAKVGEVIGILSCKGAKVVIYYNHQKRKFTIAGKMVCLLLPLFNSKENGWGGHEGIIASPRGKPSLFSLDEVTAIVKKNL